MEGNKKSIIVDWTKVSSSEEVESRETTLYLNCTEDLLQEVVDTKEKEPRKLKENDEFEVLQSASLTSN